MQGSQDTEALASAAALKEANRPRVQVAQEGPQNEMGCVNKEQVNPASLCLFHQRLQSAGLEGFLGIPLAFVRNGLHFATPDFVSPEKLLDRCPGPMQTRGCFDGILSFFHGGRGLRLQSSEYILFPFLQGVTLPVIIQSLQGCDALLQKEVKVHSHRADIDCQNSGNLCARMPMGLQQESQTPTTDDRVTVVDAFAS